MFGSPEQKSGLPADARGDVYSLAATISFALLYDKPDLRNPIHFDADEIPLTLRTALTKAMETNPRRRHADGREFHVALTSAIRPDGDVAPVPAPNIHTAGQRCEGARRGKASTALASGRTGEVVSTLHNARAE